MSTMDAVFDDGTLKVSRIIEDGILTLELIGKCIIRDANDTLMPIFASAMEESSNSDLRLVLDFRQVTYMNSSSFAPVIKVLEKARLGQQKLTICYDREQKWQTISFSAMTIFKTPDERIRIDGGSV
jgi:anti-anti-sigma regulatory factor